MTAIISNSDYRLKYSLLRLSYHLLKKQRTHFARKRNKHTKKPGALHTGPGRFHASDFQPAKRMRQRNRSRRPNPRNDRRTRSRRMPKTEKSAGKPALLDFLAERWGFEPQIRFWRIHDFQSCSFGQLGHLSVKSNAPCMSCSARDYTITRR